MASKIKADQFETLDGSGNITLNNSVTMASGKTLPAASLTGALPAISGASLTGVTSVGGATGVDFNDDVKIRSGTGNDLEIYHNGTNSIIKNSTGITKIQADDIRIQSADDSESLAKFVKDGAVSLYYNDSLKLNTGNSGVSITGNIDVTGAITGNAASGIGKVLQVKNQVQATEVTSNSATYTDTGCSLSITPTATTSKILVISSNDCTKYGADTAVAIRCYRDSTEIGGTIIGRRICDSDNSDKEQAIFSFTVLDSPNTTSAVTYKTQYNNTYAGGTVRINAGSGSSTFCLMEIGA